MSDDGELQTPAANSRTGSYADLARRMDRMETRQDNLENKVTELTTLVGRVEQNQTHVAELNKLRFDALDSGVKLLASDLKGFMIRMEGIMTGEVKTHAARELEEAMADSAQIMSDYRLWREKVEDRFDHLDPELPARVRILEARELKRSGVVFTFGTTKTVLLVIAAFLGPLMALFALLTR
jgi:hypothetical protein